MVLGADTDMVWYWEPEGGVGEGVGVNEVNAVQVHVHCTLPPKWGWYVIEPVWYLYVCVCARLCCVLEVIELAMGKIFCICNWAESCLYCLYYSESMHGLPHIQVLSWYGGRGDQLWVAIGGGGLASSYIIHFSQYNSTVLIPLRILM